MEKFHISTDSTAVPFGTREFDQRVNHLVLKSQHDWGKGERAPKGQLTGNSGYMDSIALLSSLVHV